MKTLNVALLAVVITLGLALSLAGRAAVRAIDARQGETGEAIRAVRDRLERLEAGQETAARLADELSGRIDALAKQLEAAQREERPLAAPRPALASAAVEAEDGAEAENSPSPGEKAKPPIDLDAALAELFDPRTPWSAKQGTWTGLREAGLLDKAVLAFEKRAQENPRDADIQAEAGQAYLQRVVTSNDIEKGVWAAKADAAFDAALALNPQHWGARFQKAVSLSFWPQILGKRPEAIRQFETLLGQQEAVPPRPEHAQTYLFLGNLYREQGEKEKARDTWKKGAALFPQNPELTTRAEEN